MAEVSEPCSLCQSEWEDDKDLIDRFDYAEDIDYYDGPISGYMSCRRCSRRYAFYCLPIMPHLLYHWTLVIAQTGDDWRAEMKKMAVARTGVWLSVTEDHRRLPLRMRAVLIQADECHPIAP